MMVPLSIKTDITLAVLSDFPSISTPQCRMVICALRVVRKQKETENILNLKFIASLFLIIEIKLVFEIQRSYI